jgi:hypothetical protein
MPPISVKKLVSPWDARVLLAAALGAKAPDAAQPVLDWLATSHLEDDHVRGLAAKVAQASP